MTMRDSRARAGGFLKDFQKFLLQGNVVDLAVAVIIGGAFGKIVSSLIEDIITPAILNPVMQASGVDELSKLSANGIKYGSFLAAVLNFIVIAFVIFLMIRTIEASRRKAERQEALADPQPDPTAIAQAQLIGSLERLTQALELKNQ
jgi:large conductance mechanosensitive channel